jgi:putative flippase GtrA
MLFDRTFFRFCLVGIVNTIVGWVLMFGLYNLAGFSYWMASGTSYIIGTIQNFLLNKYITFRIKHWSAKMVVAFILTIAVSYFIAFGIAKPIVNILFESYGEKVRGNIALLAGEGVFLVLNYTGQRFFAFRKKAA